MCLLSVRNFVVHEPDKRENEMSSSEDMLTGDPHGRSKRKKSSGKNKWIVFKTLLVTARKIYLV